MLFPRYAWPLSRATGLLTRNWSGELFRPGRLDSRRVLPVTLRIWMPCLGSPRGPLRTRTGHLFLAGEALYQMSYQPKATLTGYGSGRREQPDLAYVEVNSRVEPTRFERVTCCLPSNCSTD